MAWGDEDFGEDFGDAKKGYVSDQFEGEEDEDILDDWDAEPEEKQAPPPKKEPKKKEVVEWVDDALSDEEEEKQRRKKLQLKADMQHGADLFGIDDGDFGDDIDDLSGPVAEIKIDSKFDSTNPQNLQEFQKFAQWIAQDLQDRFKKNEHYREFSKALMTELTRDYDEVDLRALAGTFTAKSHEKVQAQKVPKKKKGKKKIAKEEDVTYDMVEDEYAAFM